MPKVRTSPKAYASRWRARTAAPRRKAPRRSGPRAATTSGMRPGVSNAPYKHKFTRWGNTMDVVSYNALGASNIQVNVDSGGQTTPLTVGSWSLDTSGVNLSNQFGGAFQFQLEDLPSYQDFTALFDQYRIDQVDIEVSNVHNSSTGTDAQQQMPTIIWAPDFDDAQVPTLASRLSERQRAKQWTFRGSGVPLKFSIKPRIAQPAYRDALTSPYVVGPPAFLNASYTDVPHFGVKFWMQNCYASAVPGGKGETHFRIKCKYHLSFKDPQ